MKRYKRIAALAMAACMGSALFTGCSNPEQTSSAAGQTNSTTEVEGGAQAGNFDTSKHVVLTMYCIGDEGGIYAQEHLEKVNELLTKKINAELAPVMVSWGDYKTKLPMIWAGGEAYDLTYTSNWSGYFTEGEKGAFMDITELFPTYAPQTYEYLMEKDYLDTTTIDGKYYMVPNDKPDYTGFIYNYREDLRKKYNCPEIVDKETFEVYLQAIKDNEPSMIPYANSATEAQRFQTFLNEQDWSRPLDSATGVFVYDLNDPTKVFNVVETPEYAAFIEETREYYDKGYWSQSIMAETSASKDLFEGGQTAVYMGNFSNSNNAYMNITAQHPDWEIGYYSSDLASGKVELVAPCNNGMAIGAYSKNAERAMMFIELMYNDQEVYDIVMNGIEGVTYEKDEATMTKRVPDGIDPGTIALKNLAMGFSTTKYELGSMNDSPKLNELKEEYASYVVFPELAGYSIKQDSISAELAAIKSVVDEFKTPLEKGVTAPTEGLEALKQKLKDAGVDKVMEEINSQITAYLAQ